jgi:hypothetical protein
MFAQRFWNLTSICLFMSICLSIFVWRVLSSFAPTQPTRTHSPKCSSRACSNSTHPPGLTRSHVRRMRLTRPRIPLSTTSVLISPFLFAHCTRVCLHAFVCGVCVRVCAWHCLRSPSLFCFQAFSNKLAEEVATQSCTQLLNHARPLFDFKKSCLSFPFYLFIAIFRYLETLRNENRLLRMVGEGKRERERKRARVCVCVTVN